MPDHHDRLFRHTFQRSRHAAAWLKSILPPELVAALDWRTLRAVRGTRVGPGLRAHHADAVFCVRSPRRRLLVWIVVEHKSRPAVRVRWQIQRYLENVVGKARLRGFESIVIPVVVHHGPRPWPRLRHQARWTRELSLALLPWRFRDHFVLEDLATRTESSMLQSPWPAAVRLKFLCLQFVSQASVPWIRRAIWRWRGLIRATDRARGGHSDIDAVCSWLVRATDVPVKVLAKAFDKVLQRKEHSVVSTAEKLVAAGRIEGRLEGRVQGRVQGREEGRVEGRVALLLRLLRARFGRVPVRFQRRLQKATPAQLDRWAVQLLDAGSLAEVFDG